MHELDIENVTKPLFIPVLLQTNEQYVRNCLKDIFENDGEVDCI